MELKKLTDYEPPPRRYVPAYAGNRDASEPFAVLHRPLIRAYQLEVLDLQASLEEQKPEDGAGPEALRRYAEAADNALVAYHRRVLEGHISGVDGLTSGGDPVGVDEFISIAIGIGPLVEELVAAIRDAGTLSEDDSKN